MARSISRANDSESWFVMLYVAGEQTGKRFNDDKYGSKRVALSAAISWRNQMWAESRHRRRLGVHFSDQDGYVGSWSDEDGQQRKRFLATCDRSETDALMLACEYRYAALQKHSQYMPDRLAFPDLATLFNCAIKRDAIPISPDTSVFLPWGRGLTGPEHLEAAITRTGLTYREAADKISMTTRHLRSLRDGHGDPHDAATRLLEQVT